MFTSMDQIRRANEAIHNNWFSPGTMAWWRTQLYETVYGGRYFITSECDPCGVRRFSIRRAEDNGKINTVPPFHGIATLDLAEHVARKLANGALSEGDVSSYLKNYRTGDNDEEEE